MTNPVLQALALLDSKNDAHWTDDGAPRIDVIKELTGMKSLTRNDIIQLAPEFSRVSRVLEGKSLDEDTELEGTDAQPVEDPVVALQRQSQEEADAISAKEEEINALTRELQVMRAAHDVTLETLAQSPANHTENQRNIMHYLASQHEQRIKRAQQRNKVLAQLDPNALDPRAAIDRAFQRKNDRGSSRPAPVTK